MSKTVHVEKSDLPKVDQLVSAGHATCERWGVSVRHKKMCLLARRYVRYIPPGKLTFEAFLWNSVVIATQTYHRKAERAELAADPALASPLTYNDHATGERAARNVDDERRRIA